MTARVRSLVLPLAAIAWALPLFPAPQVLTDIQVLRQRLADIEHGLSQRPDDDILLRAKVEAYRQARLFAAALEVCNRQRPSARPSVCDPPLISALEREKSAQTSLEVAARNEPRVFAVIVGVSRYQNDRMPPLPDAAADADRFFSHIEKRRPALLLQAISFS